jgi:hypothetical protein
MVCRTSSLLLVLVLSVAPGWAQERGARTVLGVRGAQFTINEKPEFLLGISYYAGLGAPAEQLRTDLDDLRDGGFHWLRVWATWAAFDHDVSAVDADGRPRAAFLKKLVSLVAEADARGLIVDVTLSRGNGVTGPPRLQTVEKHTQAALAIADALKEHRNWYLDLSNERNIKDKRFTSFAELKSIHDAVKHRFPKLLMTASHAGDLTQDDVRGYLQTVGVAFLTPHRPRGQGSPSQTAAKTKQVLAWCQELGKTTPVHYQEPFRRDFGPYQPRAADFLTDLQQARAGGAAGWCLHNGDARNAKDGRPRRSFDLRGRQRFFDRLDDVERDVVKRLNTAGSK